jgi:hypothetical protein
MARLLGSKRITLMAARAFAGRVEAAFSSDFANTLNEALGVVVAVINATSLWMDAIHQHMNVRMLCVAMGIDHRLIAI